MSTENAKKRKKSYYMKSAHGGKKGRYQAHLESGMRGFLITCGNKAQKDATREAYSLLNEYADQLYGPEFTPKEESSGSSDEEDIEKALQKEVSALKSKKKVVRRFQAVDSGANNCVFIKTTLDKPHELLDKLISDLHTTKVARSRYMMKVFPVVVSCRADSDKIKTVVSEYVHQFFKDVGDFSYHCIFKVRNNNSVTRAILLTAMNEVFSGSDLKSRVEYDDPDFVISVDVIKSVCCVSIMRDFKMYRKYNLQEIVLNKKSEPESEQKEKVCSNTKQDNEQSESAVPEGPAEVCETDNIVKDVDQNDCRTDDLGKNSEKVDTEQGTDNVGCSAVNAEQEEG